MSVAYSPARPDEKVNRSRHRMSSLRTDPADTLFDPMQIFRILRRHMWRVLTALLGCLLLGFAYLALVPARYTATAVLLFDPRQQRVLSSEGVIAGIGSDTAAIESQVELLGSNAMATRMIDKFALMDDSEFHSTPLSSKLRESILGASTDVDVEDPRVLARNRAIARFERMLTVRRRGLTYVIEVNFVSRDPRKAAAIANAVADTYLEEQIESKVTATSGASDFLSGRLEALGASVKTSEQAVADFKAQNAIVSLGAIGSGETLNQRQIEAISTQLLAARARTADASATLEQARAARGSSNFNIESQTASLRSQVLGTLRLQLATLSRREAQLSAQLGPAHPDLVAVRKQMTEATQQSRAELNRIIRNTEIEYDTARNYQGSLEASLKEIEKKGARLDSVKVRLQALEREADANRNLYAQFLARSKDTAEQKSVQKPDAQIISRAITPTQQNMPTAPIVMLLASLAGLGAGLSLALLAELRDTAYRSASELEDDFGVPCLGVMPLIRKTDSESGDDRLGSGYQDILQGICATDPRDLGKVMMIWSALPGEGKSTVASGLAGLLANAEARVLFIGPKPLSWAKSLDSTLASEAWMKTAERLRAVIAASPSQGLYYISAHLDPSGRGKPALAATHLRQLVQDAVRLFDVVIIDGPSVDTGRPQRLLFDLADSSILVVEWGRGTRDAVTTGLRSIGANADKLIGTVLNKVDARA